MTNNNKDIIVVGSANTDMVIMANQEKPFSDMGL